MNNINTDNINTNNMFIWDNKNNTVSKKNIYSKFKNNIVNLRKKYNKYINELHLISNTISNKTVRIENILKKIFFNINSIIIRTEVIVNYLFYNNWKVQNMPQNMLLTFSSSINVYCKHDKLLLESNIELLNKINIDTNKLVKITLKIINEFQKLKNKSDVIYDTLYNKTK
jgi:hypothetical protein